MEAMMQPARSHGFGKALPRAWLVLWGLGQEMFITYLCSPALGSKQEHKACLGLTRKRRYTHRKPRARQDRMRSPVVSSSISSRFGRNESSIKTSQGVNCEWRRWERQEASIPFQPSSLGNIYMRTYWMMPLLKNYKHIGFTAWIYFWHLLFQPTLVMLSCCLYAWLSLTVK